MKYTKGYRKVYIYTYIFLFNFHFLLECKILIKRDFKCLFTSLLNRIYLFYFAFFFQHFAVFLNFRRVKIDNSQQHFE